MALEDHLRSIEDQQRSLAAQEQQRAAELADRTAVANRLLSELAAETLAVLHKRGSPRALEIVAASVSVPFPNKRTTHIQVGRSIVLFSQHPGRMFGVTYDGVFVRFSDAFQVFRKDVTFTLNGPEKARLDQARAREQLAAAAQQAGCIRTVADLLPLAAFGERREGLIGSDNGRFYLDASGQLMVETQKSAEQWVAEQIAE